MICDLTLVCAQARINVLTKDPAQGAARKLSLCACWAQKYLLDVNTCMCDKRVR